MHRLESVKRLSTVGSTDGSIFSTTAFAVYLRKLTYGAIRKRLATSWKAKAREGLSTSP
ncbi:hypothetical protein M3J09_008010 [Ascochyta lentis]